MKNGENKRKAPGGRMGKPLFPQNSRNPHNYSQWKVFLKFTVKNSEKTVLFSFTSHKNYDIVLDGNVRVCARFTKVSYFNP